MHTKEITFEKYVLDGQIVYLLTFQYTETTKDHIKQTLSRLRSTYKYRTGKVGQLAGGWKAHLGYWVVAETIWVEFRATLRGYGYFFKHLQPDEADPNNASSYGGSSRQNYTRSEKLMQPNLFTHWLGIDTSNELLLRSTYRNLVKLLHPDHQRDQVLRELSEELMKLINSDFNGLKSRQAS